MPNRVCLLVLTVILATSAWAGAAPSSDDIDTGLAAWNAVRTSLGVPPVKRDPKLEQWATKHIEYMKAAGKLAHEEDKSNPKYTEEGAKSGMHSCLGMGVNRPADAILSQLGCFLHRIPLILPELESVSFCVDGGYSAFDYGDAPRRKFDWKGPIAYPPDNCPDFGPYWNGAEGPCPIPGGAPKTGVGQPITLTFALHEKVKDGTIVIKEGAADVDGWVSAPDKPATSMFGDNLQTICFIAKQPLKSKTAYTAKATATVNGKPYELTWHFTTGSGKAPGMVKAASGK
jgi:hypothetical protein